MKIVAPPTDAVEPDFWGKCEGDMEVVKKIPPRFLRRVPQDIVEGWKRQTQYETRERGEELL